MKKEKNELWLECDCGCGALKAQVDEDDDFECDFGIYFSLWSRGKYNSRSWMDRISLAWTILRHGDTYSDAVILKRPDKVQELIDFLEKNKNYVPKSDGNKDK